MWFKKTRNISTLLDIAIKNWESSKVDGYSDIDLFILQTDYYNRFDIIISNYEGLCDLFHDLHRKKIITQKERDLLSAHIFKNKPEFYEEYCPYFFRKNYFQPRLDYLLKLKKEIN